MDREKANPAHPAGRTRRIAAVVLAGVLIGGIGLGTSVVWSFSKPAPPRAEFAPPAPSTDFDGDQAFAYLVEICKLGPRPTASEGMRAQQEVLKAHFRALGAVVEEQSFEATQPSLGPRPFRCTNLIVRFHPDSTARVLLGAHYDTRPYPDQEPLFRRRGEPYLGANDGASGVAFLMELGRLILSLKLDVGVDFVFFDAEEYIHAQDRDEYFLGSKHFVDRYVHGRPTWRYDAIVVVDMIADKDLQLHPDERSATRAGHLVKQIWSLARQLGVPAFHSITKYEVLDDHIPFLDAGLPAVDIIDFDYPHWHRVSDTPDKCSGESLAAVAKVIVAWLQQRRAGVP